MTGEGPGRAAPVDVSVVIPTSGRWRLLQRTLAALTKERAALVAVPPARAPRIEVIVVVDGDELVAPAGLAADALFVVARGGPGAARNRGTAAACGRLLLFLGDDTVPRPGLIAAHLAAHAADPGEHVAVLGRVVWGRSAAWRPVNAWLEASGSQFDYSQIAREDPSDIGFGRFYSANVSLAASLFARAGGYDPRFTFAYEDLDLGWRLAALGMRLRYAPDAVAVHRHPYTLADAERRFGLIGEGEQLMAATHDWFSPWFRERFGRNLQLPAGPRAHMAAWVAPWVPGGSGPVRRRVRAAADRHFHHRLAGSFFAGWDRAVDLAELREYLGPRFELDRLHRHETEVDAEAERIGDEQRFYRTSEAYLYDLTAFAMAGTKEPYHEELRRLAPPGARLLDYGCGIGADGLRLLERGYRVEFADFANPSTAFLRWRLSRRGLTAPVYDLDRDVPAGFTVAFAFDVIEHVDDPFAFLGELESRAALVLVNLLEPVRGDIALHRALPIDEILRHARRRGLRLHRRLHGRSILVAYRGSWSGGPK